MIGPSNSGENFSGCTDREQFFDMENDPGELQNLIAAPSLAGEVARHRKLLEQWRAQTRDEIGRRPAMESATRRPSRGQDGVGRPINT